jgi:hypothetical protein
LKWYIDKIKPSHDIHPTHGPTGKPACSHPYHSKCPFIIKASYTKAARAELAQDYAEALRLYIKATEGFLHLSRGSADDTEKARWKKEAGKALERAERIKGVKGQGGLRGEVDFWSDGTCTQPYYAALHALFAGHWGSIWILQMHKPTFFVNPQ